MPVTALVQEWFNGTQPNDGVLLMGDERVQERQRVFYSLNAANDLYPRIVVDYSVSIDTIPPYASVDPLSPYVDSNFNVTWSGQDESGGSGIAYYDVQYLVPGEDWQNWLMHTTATSGTYYGGQNGVTYQFRTRAVDNAGNVQAFGGAQSQTIVDSAAPIVTVNPLPEYTFSAGFTVSWSGTDNGGSGIAYYDVQYRRDGSTWQNWQMGTTATSAQFTGGQDGVTYRFRARGVDFVGNVQPLDVHQAETTVELKGPASHMLPFADVIVHSDSFPISWSGQAEPGKSILYYDVYVRFDDGPWQLWLAQTQNTSATFDAQQGDGLYTFEVRATDNEGASEMLTGKPEATITVDAVAPFIVPMAWLPLAFR
ncbi:MAG: fibronectin type III domain-containing protein [Caldilineaceae bacterium]